MHVFACNDYYIVLQPSKYNSTVVERNIAVNFVSRFIQEKVAVQLVRCVCVCVHVCVCACVCVCGKYAFICLWLVCVYKFEVRVTPIHSCRHKSDLAS